LTQHDNQVANVVLLSKQKKYLIIFVNSPQTGYHVNICVAIFLRPSHRERQHLAAHSHQGPARDGTHRRRQNISQMGDVSSILPCYPAHASGLKYI
jgi:hypothetical protein